MDVFSDRNLHRWLNKRKNEGDKVCITVNNKVFGDVKAGLEAITKFNKKAKRRSMSWLPLTLPAMTERPLFSWKNNFTLVRKKSVKRHRQTFYGR